jgi:hypothetical protein
VGSFAGYFAALLLGLTGWEVGPRPMIDERKNTRNEMDAFNISVDDYACFASSLACEWSTGTVSAPNTELD